MDMNRRRFIRGAGWTALGIGGGLPFLRVLGSAVSAGPGTRQWGMIIDVAKCQSPAVQQRCIDACHTLHNVPTIKDPEEEVKWLWTEPFENAFPDQAHPRTADALKGKPVFVLCNHCTNPPCVKVCPTQATWKRKSDGIVMMDMHRCIGCRYCIAACPYGARSFNWRDPRPHIPGGIQGTFPTRSAGVVEKCNFCMGRLRDQLRAGREPMPACVEAAENTPGGKGALLFGDLSDPDSKIVKRLREVHTICRKPSVGTGPNIFYIV